ncbi:hypothetical protein HK105_207031 [Polyrhizophydium stewartii]|uniref:Afadin and alpha-actinin-binding-domain-containing protein n=1 Tax=Polyrhizophydium stewartii TaxID=2732419 RepID=A0ABR4N1N7_9FUNG
MLSFDANLENSIAYVNRELVGLGLSDPLYFQVSAATQPHVKAVVACIFSLLQQRQRDARFREDMQERLHQMHADNDNLTGTIARQRAKEEQLEREIASLKTKLSSSLKSQDSITSKLTAAKEELKVATAAYQHAKTQFTHECRRLASENARLKERIQKAAADKKPPPKPRIALSAPLAPSFKGSVETRVKQDPNEEMFQIVIRNYEEREKETLAENEVLRQTLFDVYCEMKTHLEAYWAQAGEGQFQPLHPEVALVLNPETLRDPIQQVVRQGLAVLSIEPPAHTQASPEEIAKMEQQIADLKHSIDEREKTIAEQGKLLEMALNQTAEFLEHEDDDDGDEAEARHQRSDLEEQWRQLEREREQIDEDKRTLDTQKFLSTLPPTPAWLKKAAQAPAGDSPAPRSPRQMIDRFREINEQRARTPAATPRFRMRSDGDIKDDILVESETLMATRNDAQLADDSPAVVRRSMSTSAIKSAFKSKSSKTDATPGTSTRSVRISLQGIDTPSVSAIEDPGRAGLILNPAFATSTPF